MLRRPDPLAIALALSAGAAETVPFAALVTWLVTVFGGDPSRVPSWPAIAATWLLAYLTARLVLGQTQDPTWARTIAVVGWIGWTLSWWTARAATPWAVLEFLPALVRLEAGAVGLLVLSALVWWRALGLASEPHPFQGGYLRWAVARDLGLGGGVVLAAVLSGGEAARAVWEFLAWAAPLLVLLRLATAALVQAEAVRLAYPAATSAGAWVLRSLVVAGGVLGVGALVSLLAGPALWPHIARPVFWFLTFLVAVLVTMMLALAVIVWTALRFLVWAVQALAGRGEPGPPPSPPAFPDLARPHEAVQSLALPSWALELLAGLLGFLLLAVLALSIARAFRRFRGVTQEAVATEVRERVGLGGLRTLRPHFRFPKRPLSAQRTLLAPTDVRSAYRATLALLARRGLSRRPSETPNQLAQRVTQTQPTLAAPLADLTFRYLWSRYGEREAPDDRRAAVDDWRAIERSLSERG